MNSAAPQIGFDRLIQLDWLTCALKFRAGFASMDELNNLVDAAGLGVAARKKTRTVGCRNKPLCPSYVLPAFWLPMLSKKAWRFLRTV
jgi:hypothetical protein